MFDCVMPTRNGRHGAAFTRFGQINLDNARHRDDPRPLDEQSPYETTRTYSRAYLHHLVRANEMLGAMLLSAINLAYYQELMAGMRDAIERAGASRNSARGRAKAGTEAICRRCRARLLAPDCGAARSGRIVCRSGSPRRAAS